MNKSFHLFLFFILTSSLFLLGCQEEVVSSAVLLEIPFIQFQKIYQEQPSLSILDVRTPFEYQLEHAPQAFLLPLQELNENPQQAIEKIPFSKEEPLYVICRSGNRSYHAVKILQELGFKKALSVKGGMILYQQAKLPIKQGF